MAKSSRLRVLAYCVTLLCVGAESSNAVWAAGNINNACDLFREKIGWRTITSEASEKWGIPVSSILAIMHQESRFNSTATAKTTTAFGYSQALNGTWEEYRAATNSTHAVRSSLTDSADFIGWYMTQTEKKIGLSLDDVADHYLTYHEGHNGYQSRRWKKQPKLIQIAKDVATRAAMYEKQLQRCRRSHEDVLAGTAAKPVGKLVALAALTTSIPRRKPDSDAASQAQVYAGALLRWASFR